MELKANWQHDCDECELIGTFQHLGMPYDVWIHEHKPVEADATLIIRYSDEGPEYHSLPMWAAKEAQGTMWKIAFLMYLGSKGQ